MTKVYDIILVDHRMTVPEIDTIEPHVSYPARNIEHEHAVGATSTAFTHCGHVE